MSIKHRNTEDSQIAFGAFVFCIRVVLMIVLFMPLIVSTSTFFPFVVGKAIFYRIFIEIAFLMWIPLLVMCPKFRTFKSPITIALSTYMLIAVLSSFTGVSLNISIWSTYERMQGVFDLFHWFLYFLMLSSLFRSVSQWKVLLSVNLLVSALVCFIGLSQYFGLHDLVSTFAANNPSERIQSSLGNAAYVGAYCVANIFISSALISKALAELFISKNNVITNSNIKKNKRLSKATASNKFQNSKLELLMISFWTICLGVNLITLLLSGTRGAWLGFGIAVLGAAILYSISGQVKHIKSICLAFIMIFIVLIISFISFRDTDLGIKIGENNVIAGRVIDFKITDSSVMNRWHTWRAGLKASVDKPILGWGPDNFGTAWGRHFDASNTVKEKFDQAHNKLIEELTTKGIVGLISYCSIWLILAYTLTKQYIATKSVGNQGYILLISAGLFGYFIQNLFLFDTAVTYLQFIILLSMVSNVTTGFWISEKEDYHSFLNLSGITVRIQKIRFYLSHKILLYGSLVVLIPIVFYSIYSYSVKTYTAAQHTVYLTYDTYPSWEEKVDVYDSAITDAPNLANYPRVLMIEGIAQDWYLFSPEIKLDALTIVEQAALDGLKQEPENWRLTYMLARFYQIASSDNKNLMDKADYYVNKTESLAPGTDEAQVARDINNQAHEYHKSQSDIGSE